MSATWLADMAAAKVPLLGGMRIRVERDSDGAWLGNALVQFDPTPPGEYLAIVWDTDGDGVLFVAEHTIVPLIDDRATFLLCLDEAERRGVPGLTLGNGAHYRLGAMSNIALWDSVTVRPLLVAALARALRDTAPATVTPDAPVVCGWCGQTADEHAPLGVDPRGGRLCPGTISSFFTPARVPPRPPAPDVAADGRLLTLTGECAHGRTRTSTVHRLGLQYGSAEIIVCDDCGAWRDGRSETGPWNVAGVTP